MAEAELAAGGVGVGAGRVSDLGEDAARADGAGDLDDAVVRRRGERGAVDGADSDCQIDCSVYDGNRTACRNAGCKYGNKTGLCTNP